MKYFLENVFKLPLGMKFKNKFIITSNSAVKLILGFRMIISDTFAVYFSCSSSYAREVCWGKRWRVAENGRGKSLQGKKLSLFGKGLQEHADEDAQVGVYKVS